MRASGLTLSPTTETHVKKEGLKTLFYMLKTITMTFHKINVPRGHAHIRGALLDAMHAGQDFKWSVFAGLSGRRGPKIEP
jgi:hypothetical protein